MAVMGPPITQLQKAEEKAREKDAALQRAHEKEVVADCKMS